MVMALFDCSSPHDVTISAASQSTLLDRIEECLQHRRSFLRLWFARTRSIPVTTFFNHRGVPRIWRGGPRGGGGGARSAKEANKPNKRATGLKPRTCAHQGSMFRP